MFEGYANTLWEPPSWRFCFERPGYLCCDQFGARQRPRPVRWQGVGSGRFGAPLENGLGVITLATWLAQADASTTPREENFRFTEIYKLKIFVLITHKMQYYISLLCVHQF
jgi:hypothetical protein